MKMTNVKNAVAIGVLGVGLTSLAPLARDTTFGGPISIQPKTPVVSIDATQSATNIWIISYCLYFLSKSTFHMHFQILYHK